MQINDPLSDLSASTGKRLAGQAAKASLRLLKPKRFAARRFLKPRALTRFFAPCKALHFFIEAECISDLQRKNPNSVESSTPPKFQKNNLYIIEDIALFVKLFSNVSMFILEPFPYCY